MVILGHFLPFYPPKNHKNQILKNKLICGRYHFTHVCQKSQSYDVWFLRYGVRQTEFFVILGHFFPFFLMILKINILKKKWKTCLEILSFFIYMCTINKDHMTYGSWNIRCDRQKFLSFLGHSLPFQSPDNP